MLEPGYLIAAVGLAGVITVALRVIPFLALRPLRESQLVKNLAVWMPVGVLLILTAVTLFDAAAGGRTVDALIALAVTVVVHLVSGRRSLLSIAAGTLTFVALVNWL